jgi:MerR family transcriptional regulator, activator of bmr gene
MENLLSIGELAKIRNVNVQSLRYYEKLGILIPVYTNPDSGYRYYSLEQIMILDTIILCVDLGIPLKDLRHYVNSDGELEFEHLLEDGKTLAKEKIQKIESSLDSINRTLQHITAQKDYLGREGYYSRQIFTRYLLTIPCDLQMDAKTYENQLSRLFSLARKEGLQASFPHGIIAGYRGGIYQQSVMFLEVLPSDAVQIRQIEAGTYLCYQEPREVHSNPLDIFPQKLTGKDSADVIISCMSPNTYKYDEVILEFQMFTSE